MFENPYATFQKYLDNDWVKRAKLITDTVEKLRNFDTILNIPRVIKTVEKSKKIKNILTFLQDVGKFNITKLKENSFVLRAVSKNTKLKYFLTTNAEKVEELFTSIARFNKYIPESAHKSIVMNASNSIFHQLKNITNFVKKAGTIAIFVDLGYKLYQNYKTTKSVGKTVIGTLVDYVGDFTIFDGILFGSYFGPIGVGVGITVGSITMALKFFKPKIFEDLKQTLFNEYDQIFQPKVVENTTSETIFAIDKTIFEERILFYKKVLEKLEQTLQALNTFKSKFKELTSGLSANVISETQLVRYIKKIQILKIEFIEKTLQDLKMNDMEVAHILNLQTKLSFNHKRALEISKINYIELLQVFNRFDAAYQNLLVNITQIPNLDIVLKRNLKQNYIRLSQQKHHAKKLWDMILVLENKKTYE